MAKLNISLDKCHIAIENIWVIFKYHLIMISNIISEWYENRLCMISIPLHHEIIFYLVLCPRICSIVSWFIVYGNLNRICILHLCENCINLNYVELVHDAFWVYYILLLFCLFILLIFKSLLLKLQPKILIYLLKK